VQRLPVEENTQKNLTTEDTKEHKGRNKGLDGETLKECWICRGLIADYQVLTADSW